MALALPPDMECLQSQQTWSKSKDKREQRTAGKAGDFSADVTACCTHTPSGRSIGHQSGEVQREGPATHPAWPTQEIQGGEQGTREAGRGPLAPMCSPHP